MIAPLLVIVLVAPRGAVPVGPMVADAAGRALGDAAPVQVEERDVIPNPDEAVALERAKGANAIVLIAWRDAAGTEAVVRAYGRRGWTERDVEFAAGDPPEQRGKTLGFVVASLVADDVATPEATTPVPTPVPPPAAATAPRDLLLLEASGLFIGAGGAEPVSGGAGASFLVPLVPVLAVDLTADVGFGAADDAHASLTTLHLGGGGTLRLLRHTRTWEIDLRADALATQVAASRGGLSESGWLPAIGGTALAVWSPVGPRLGFFTLAGVDGALGRVSIDVGNAPSLAVAPWQVRVGVGVRTGF